MLAQCSLVLLSAVPLLARSTSARAFEAAAAQVAVELPQVAVQVAVAVPLLVRRLLRVAVLLLRACSQRVRGLPQVVPVQL